MIVPRRFMTAAHRDALVTVGLCVVGFTFGFVAVWLGIR